MSETNVGISPEQNDALMGKLETVEKMLSERMANEEFEKSISERIDKLEGVVENIIKAMDEKKKYEEEEGEEKGEGEDEDDGEKKEKSLEERVDELFRKKMKETPFVKGFKDSSGDDGEGVKEPQTFTKSLGAIFGVTI